MKSETFSDEWHVRVYSHAARSSSRSSLVEEDCLTTADSGQRSRRIDQKSAVLRQSYGKRSPRENKHAHATHLRRSPISLKVAIFMLEEGDANLIKGGGNKVGEWKFENQFENRL